LVEYLAPFHLRMGMTRGAPMPLRVAGALLAAMQRSGFAGFR
jgi:hypothetical protein